jgi:hypothetical protein
MGGASQHKDKIGGVGFGLSLKEKITPADTVLVEESINGAGLVLSISCSC